MSLPTSDLDVICNLIGGCGSVRIAFPNRILDYASVAITVYREFVANCEWEVVVECCIRLSD